MDKLLGANWRTTVTNLVALIFATATAIAAAPSELDVLPTALYPYRGRIIAICGVIAFVSRLLNGQFQKDKAITGGTTQQDATGAAVPDAQATLVNITKGDTAAANDPARPARFDGVITKAPILMLFALLASCASFQNIATPANTRIATAIVCSNTLNFAVSDKDRSDVANYLYSVAHGIRTLSGGKVPTADELKTTVSLFTTKSGRWVSLGTSISSIYGGIYAQIQGNPKVALGYLEAIAAGCEDAASPYLPKT